MKRPNATDSENFPITLSVQSVQLLDEIAKNGIWGRNKAEVAARFVDKALEAFVEQPKLKLPKIKLRSDGDIVVTEK
jgi:hypothetical protein